MDNEEKELDFNLELVMQQLHEASTQDDPAGNTGEIADILSNLEDAPEEAPFADADSDIAAQASQLFSEAAEDVPAAPADFDTTGPLPDLSHAFQTQADAEASEPAAEVPEEPPLQPDPTVRMDAPPRSRKPLTRARMPSALPTTTGFGS